MFVFRVTDQGADRQFSLIRTNHHSLYGKRISCFNRALKVYNLLIEKFWNEQDQTGTVCLNLRKKASMDDLRSSNLATTIHAENVRTMREMLIAKYVDNASGSYSRWPSVQRITSVLMKVYRQVSQDQAIKGTQWKCVLLQMCQARRTT